MLAAAGGDFPNPFPVEELFRFPALFGEGTLFAFNRTALLLLVVAAVVCGLMLAAFREPKIVPGRFQSAMEGIVEFIREQIVVQVIGPAGLRYVPALTALFLFILVSNFFEVAPLINFPPTSRMAMPAFLAIMVWTLFVLVGIRSQGLGGYFKGVAIPPGVPVFILPLVVPIELAQTFIVRPLTLAIRLFANMMAGHILLSIVFIASNAFLLDVHAFPTIGLPSFAGFFVGLLMLVAGPALVAFEIMVGGLQAYIFTILTAFYLSTSIAAEH